MLASCLTKRSRRIAFYVLLAVPVTVVASAWLPFHVSEQLKFARFIVCEICFILVFVWCGLFVREEPVFVRFTLWVYALLLVLLCASIGSGFMS